jgi:hypothetical protein
MSLLLLFLAINTLLFAAFVCLPTASPFLKSLYEDWQRSRAEKKQKEHLKSVVNACLAHSLEPDQIVYAEPPDEAKNLLTANGRARVVEGIARNGSSAGPGSQAHLFTLAGWRPPAVLNGAEPLGSLLNQVLPNSAPRPPDLQDDNILFLHARKTPAGKERLVWVCVSTRQSANALSESDPITEQALSHHPSNDRIDVYQIVTRRKLTAHVFDPADLSKSAITSITFQETDRDRALVLAPPMRNSAGTLVVPPGRFLPRNLWRIRAAQPDPNDPTHLTIPYDIDGKPGTIDANLNDGDRLLFTPRTGRLLAWTTGNDYTWDLSAAPTTQPTP